MEAILLKFNNNNTQVLLIINFSLGHNCLSDDAVPVLIEAIQTFKNLETLS